MYLWNPNMSQKIPGDECWTLISYFHVKLRVDNALNIGEQQILVF
jgi:hypothetical protein